MACYQNWLTAVGHILDVLPSCRVFKRVEKCDLLPRASLVGKPMIRSVKNICTPSEKCESRFVKHAHRDGDKSLLLHDSATLRQPSVRNILSLTPVYHLGTWSLEKIKHTRESNLPSASFTFREIVVVRSGRTSSSK